MHPWHDVPPGAKPPDELNVIVEIPRGSRNKYELDKETGLLKFDRLLYSAMHYPGDYGFIPRTLGGDGDPLDVLITTTVPTFPGCMMVVRPLGIFEMRDDKGMDEKVLAVPVEDPLYGSVHALDDVAPHFLREVEHFFAVYKDLEGGTVAVQGWAGLERARQIIDEACARYRETYPDRGERPA